MNTGRVFLGKKEYDNSLDYFAKALEMYKRVLPEQHHSIARCLCNIGCVYEDQLNFNRALVFYRQTYEMNEKVLSSEHIYLTKDLNRIVGIYKKKNGQYEEAMDVCIKKLAEQRVNLPQNHPRIGHTRETIGNIYSETDSAQALVFYHEALTIFERCMPSEPKATADCLEHNSTVYSNLGTFDEALKYRNKALDILGW
ncbi:unnamed protein product [Rotaria sp. Silwood1]|nr:unnamed protein product [Rotaria sp. Silwood1]